MSTRSRNKQSKTSLLIVHPIRFRPSLPQLTAWPLFCSPRRISYFNPEHARSRAYTLRPIRAEVLSGVESPHPCPPPVALHRLRTAAAGFEAGLDFAAARGRRKAIAARIWLSERGSRARTFRV